MSYIGRTPTNAALIASDLADGIVGTTKIAADAVTAAKIADNAVVTAAINADAVTDAKIADDVVGTEHLTANEVDTAALKGDAVTSAELADDAVDSEHYTDGSIDTAHLADGQVTIGKLATAVLTGATDSGAAIVDADLLLIDDGAGGTLRKTAASRLKTYTGGVNTPAFLAYVNSSTQTIANNSTVKITNYNAEEFDTDNAFSGGQFTVPVTGRYVFHANVSTDDSAAITNKQFNIQIKAGSTTISSNTILKAPYTQFGISAMALLNANTVISMHMYQDSGSNVNLEGNRRTFFGGFRLTE